MSQAMVDQIREAEARAESLRAEAAAEARERVRSVEEETARWKEDALRDIRAGSRASVAEAERQADIRVQGDLQREAERLAVLRREAESHMDNAVRWVLERIVE